MAMPRSEFVFGFEDIAELVAVPAAAVRKDVHDGVFNPKNLGSLVDYVVRKGRYRNRAKYFCDLLRDVIARENRGESDSKAIEERAAPEFISIYFEIAEKRKKNLAKKRSGH